MSKTRLSHALALSWLAAGCAMLIACSSSSETASTAGADAGLQAGILSLEPGTLPTCPFPHSVCVQGSALPEWSSNILRCTPGPNYSLAHIVCDSYPACCSEYWGFTCVQQVRPLYQQKLEAQKLAQCGCDPSCRAQFETSVVPEYETMVAQGLSCAVPPFSEWHGAHPAGACPAPPPAPPPLSPRPNPVSRPSRDAGPDASHTGPGEP